MTFEKIKFTIEQIRKFDNQKKETNHQKMYALISRCIAYYSDIDFSKMFDKGDKDNSVQGHYGGDYYLMHDTVRYLNGDKSSVSITAIEDSINSHVVCYAAEKSRKESVVVALDKEF